MSEGSVFEQLLKRDGVLVYKTKGVSMRPLFKQNRDLVTIRPKPAGRLKKYDVPLYRKRGGGYLLHRIIGVTDSGYIIRGDNNFFKETNVTDDDIVGVMTEFVRKGKHYSVDSKGYKLYAHVWNFIYPIRLILRKPVRMMWKIKCKIKGLNA